MLSAHPLIEGTMELPEMANIAQDLPSEGTYPSNLAELPRERLDAMGQDYIRRSRLYRGTDRPFFVDKMPNNWLHVVLILLALPDARIVDARRDPMATCFSAFKQLFAKGQNYTYDQVELGTFYRDYLRLTSHLDAVLPGRVHRVHHERLVENPGHELRRLLDYCGLAFDPACLRFHESGRPVRTASSEQVRRPISRAGLERWKHYREWLGPLSAALDGVDER
jgi:hypothetical protein